MNQDIAIRVSNLSKSYSIGKKKDTSLRSSLSGILKKSPTTVEKFWALKDISFEINKGDVIGIIGKNGAGKSTLLKILSQITKPTEGRLEINGRIASLLEVGTGFHPELTGRENIYLNGTILGMTRKEVKEKFDEIVEFSGVEKFIDTPVKHYSSGMYVRLAFAVAAHLEPEILIIDEVLAVGDAEFQKKCLGKMKDVAGEGRTVLFVSHNIPSVKTLCNKGIVLNHGKIEYKGDIVEAVKTYLTSNSQMDNFYFQKQNLSESDKDLARLIDFKVNPRTGDVITMFSGIDFIFTIESYVIDKNLDFTIEVVNQEDLIIFHNGSFLSQNKDSVIGSYNVVCSLPQQLLNTGIYSINLIIGENQRIVLKKYESLISFDVLQEIVGSNSSKLPGVIFPELKTKIEVLPL